MRPNLSARSSIRASAVLCALGALAVSGCGLIVRGEDYLTDGGEAPPSDGGAGMDSAAGDDGGGSSDGGAGDDGQVPMDGDRPDVPEVPNRPPVGSGAGLSNYRPLLGETLQVFVGPTHDPDGDGVTRDVQWFHNGEELTDATGLSLLLDSTRFAVGDEITVQVRLSDGELDGDPVSGGPAVIRADDQTRWNLLFPPRGEGAASAIGVLDPVRQRLLYRAFDREGDFGLWEAQLGSAAPRWVRLSGVAGTAPDIGGNAIIPDPERQRLLFFGGLGDDGSGNQIDSHRLWELDVSGSQGAESWRELAPSGDVPPGRAFTSWVRIEEEGQPDRVLVYGGFGADFEMRNDLYELVLEPAPVWRRLAVPLPAEARVGATLVHDAARGRVLMLGGGTPPTGGAEFPTPTDAIYALDLSDEASGFVVQTETLPTPLLGGGAFVEAGEAAIVGGAVDPDVSLNEDVIVVDLASLASSLEESAGLRSFFARPISRGPFAEGRWVTHVTYPDLGAMEFHELTGSSRTWEVLSQAGATHPPVAYQGMADGYRGGIRLVYGRTSFEREEILQDVWTYTEGAWRRDDLHPDPVAGSPPARYGVVGDTLHPFGAYVFPFVGGQTESGLADGRLWLANEDDWNVAATAAGATTPPPRVGHSVARGWCDNVALFVGGRDPNTATLSGDTWVATCAPSTWPPTGCEWSQRGLLTGRATPAVWAAISQLSRADGPDAEHTVRIGGLGSSGPIGEVWFFDACSNGSFGASSWTLASAAGSPPSPRFGQSLSAVLDDSLTPARVVELYLFGGGEDEDGEAVSDELHRVTWNEDPAAPEVTFTPVTAAGAPPPRMFHVAAYDRTQHRILVYGGLSDRRAMGDLWELRLR